MQLPEDFCAFRSELIATYFNENVTPASRLKISGLHEHFETAHDFCFVSQCTDIAQVNTIVLKDN